MELRQYQRVHINADTKDWGRVCSDATILRIYRNQYVQVRVDTIRAIITVKRSEIAPIK